MKLAIAITFIAAAYWVFGIFASWLGWWPMPKCPSGKRHRVQIGTVTDYKGREWCWHRDCMRESWRLVKEETDEEPT